MKNTLKTIVTCILVCFAAISYGQEPPPADAASDRGKKLFDDFDKFVQEIADSKRNASLPIVKCGDKKDGGIVYWVDAGGKHGLIVWENDLGIKKWEESVEACKKLGPGWRMPAKDELDKLYKANMEMKILSSYFFFHSATESEPGVVWRQSLSSGNLKTGYKTGTASTAAVRNF